MTAFVVGLLVLASLPSGPPWIPEEPPLEDRRITHPQGFSIVKPPDWFVKIGQEGAISIDEINLLATNKKIRHYPRIYVCTFKQTPIYLSNYHETVFLNMKAYEKTVLRAGSGDYFTYDLYITNQNRWYQLIYQIPADIRNPSITSVPETMMPYLQSFRPIP